jgi:hypothetical protein
MRKWLARLSFILIIVAAVLAWEAWRTRRGDHGPGREWRAYACVVGAALCLGLGLRGVRERHQPRDGEIVGDDDPGDRPPRDEKR